MKTLLLALIALTSINAFAVCQNQTTIYSEEDDEIGVELSLAYECHGEHAEVCVYSNGILGGATGYVDRINIRTNDLYKRKFKETEKQLKMTSKSDSFFESLLDFKSVEVEIDKKTLKGRVKVRQKGEDSAREKASLSCEKLTI